LDGGGVDAHVVATRAANRTTPALVRFAQPRFMSFSPIRVCPANAPAFQPRRLMIARPPTAATLVSQSSLSRDNFDFEKSGPEFSRYEQAIACRVVSNAVQDCLGIQPVSRRHQAA
jgi:hypothetical protein